VEKTVVSLEEIRSNPTVQALIRKADEHLGAQGYTELAAIAGYLHDIGNVVNRRDHATAGAVLAFDLLLRAGMDAEDAAIVAGAIGNHEESTGEPVNAVSAALIIADKADVHRSRVRNQNPATFDIHDRVNDASQHSFVRVDPERRLIMLELTIDLSKASVVDYFEIFLTRMLFIRKAAQFLGCGFQLFINRTQML